MLKSLGIATAFATLPLHFTKVITNQLKGIAMKKSILLASVAAFALTAPAFAAEKETYKSETKIEKDAKGNYDAKNTVSKTDAAGTTTTSEKKVDVDVDSNGNVEKVVKTKETTDPKGLMNKTSTTTTSTETHKDGQVETSHKKVVDGKTVEDTSKKQ
jgi:hypothetical protein